MNKKVLSILLILCMLVLAAPAALAAPLTGSGTEADPFLINSLEDLKTFRDSVNDDENTYEGKYVLLTADIDMAGENWDDNIGDAQTGEFRGIFDGGNHVLSNLTSTESSQIADGYVCAGLFGYIRGDAVIKNLIIENVSIDTGSYTGNNVGAVVGFVYKSTGAIENVTVRGNVQINAKGMYGVGAIAGYVHPTSSTVIANCQVNASVGSQINGLSATGGIVGYTGGTTSIQNCSISNVAVSSTASMAGGITGVLVSNSEVIGGSVSNVVLSVGHENWQNSTGVVAGSMASSAAKVSGVTSQNVTTNGQKEDAIVGSEYKEHPTTPVKPIEASAGDTFYPTLEKALEKAQDGDTVKLYTDVDLSNSDDIDASNLVIDLNGHTLPRTQRARISLTAKTSPS